MKRNICILACTVLLTSCAEPIEKGNTVQNVQNFSLEDEQCSTMATETTVKAEETTSMQDVETSTAKTELTTISTTNSQTTSTTTASMDSTTSLASTTLTTVTETGQTTADKAFQTIQETESVVIATTATETTTTTAVQGIRNLPYAMQQYVDNCKAMYPGVHIGCGVFSLDGESGYAYNADEEIYSACTIKAPYAMYVLKECEKQGLNLWTTKIMYTQDMYNGGSGIIKNGPVNTEYSIGYLLSVLLKISDNTAYNVLVSRFGLQGYQAFLNEFGGQNLYGSQYGRASVNQRLNEWVEIVKYINSGSAYAQVLKEDLTGTRTYNSATGAMQIDPNGSQYCYLVEWMTHNHEYMHKSGWSYGSYMSACDCAVIDNQYLIIVMSADYETGLSRTDILRGFGSTVEAYVDSVGGTQYLFS